MSVVCVEAVIESAGVFARVRGEVDAEAWKRACDDCSVPVRVKSVDVLIVRFPEVAFFPKATVERYYAGALDRSYLQAELERRWLEGEPVHAFGAEVREVKCFKRPPGVVPLFGGDEDGVEE